jgi:hypothetical protein
MKAILIVLVIGISCQIANAEDAKSAALQKEHCESYVAIHSGAQVTPRLADAGNWCFAYMRGMKDAMDGDLGWLDDLHKQVVVGAWADGVTVDQLIRVFVKYANSNPEKLNQSAVVVFRESVEAANLYTYTPATAGK